jgi:cobalt-precorrin 5A hydrolase/precorrin-3B C17-methyltransferase
VTRSYPARVVVVSVTAAGADLARRLPFEHRPGPVAPAVAAVWDQVDAVVVVGATGIAVRAVAPLLRSKAADPAVVCVDDAARHVVALTGGHAGGGNDLAVTVAGLLGAEAVLSTATDLAGLPALDRLPGLVADGDLAGVTRSWLDGRAPRIERDPTLAAWPVPLPSAGADEQPPGGGRAAAPSARAGDPRARSTPDAPADRGRVLVTDRAVARRPGLVTLRPRSLVIGAGASRGADPAGLVELAASSLAGAGLHPGAVAGVATLDTKADEPAVAGLARHLGVPLVCFPPEVLADRTVPHPSPVVAAAVGTPSVAEAAALVAAGAGAALVVPKVVSAGRDSTLAVARRAGPPGHLAVVGLGPGRPDQRTAEAAAAVRAAEVVIGYGPYVDQAADLLGPAQEVVRSPIGAEVDRCRLALERAAAGRRVALVCSGDAGVYALASLVGELAPAAGWPPVDVVPGITAAVAAAALLGGPLGHDHASVSLSDLLTPWPEIVRRIEAVAAGDFVVSIYNPRSTRRTTQLPEALAILARHRPPTTPAAVLTDIGRPGQSVLRTTLGDLDPAGVGMLSLVVVGSRRTRWSGSWMVTPRGYAT